MPYQSEDVFSNDELFEEIRKMIKLIHEIQLLTCKLREVFVSDEIQQVNDNKWPHYPNQMF